MKRTLLIFFFAVISYLAPPAIAPAKAALPAWVLAVIKEGIKKVIRAIDLMIQRLQNETIALQNIAKAIENELSKLKLTEIAQWTQKQRDLYKKYYNDLWKVRNTIQQYKRVKMVVARQQQIIRDYQFMWRIVNEDKHFTSQEISFMYRVYTGILDQSIYNIDQIMMVISSFKTQMSDAKRLELIDKTADAIDQSYADLQQFNTSVVQLSINRAKDLHEVESVKKLYGLR